MTANVFGNDQTFSADVRSPVDATINVAGRDVAAAVRSFTFYAGVNQRPRVELELACSDATRLASEHTEVVMLPATHDLLVDAGWRPPKEHTQPETERAAAQPNAPAPEAIAEQARRVAAAHLDLAALILAACPGPHEYVQHRDRRPPWCNACRYTAAGFKVNPGRCSTCQGSSRETVGMVCQACGRDYGPGESVSDAPYSAPGTPATAPERARAVAETMPTVGRWPGREVR